ncbi:MULTISPECIES: hypothetical protein [unclassified Nocardioides]|uniref:hypothetical protein n=1 Tax=unclassified Nocardioides TaxID=2615069 RepID=UPI0009F088FA|nr:MULTISPECIES: hypothetical protein [unclassified Nocardioides]GAW47862.1 Glycosyl transferase [Nocardioides sp. PD653-B2]GAW53836.1 Glycosyl transferase [Nocardioides sp. PD653]
MAPAILSLGMGLSAAALLARHRWALPLAAFSVTPTTRSLRQSLPPVAQGRIAAGLAVRGLGWAVRQEARLLLRHWWPLTALALPFSRSVRRAAATAVLLDVALFLRERPGVDPATALVARRLDDLAFGAGLWWGPSADATYGASRCGVPAAARGGHQVAEHIQRCRMRPTPDVVAFLAGRSRAFV